MTVSELEDKPYVKRLGPHRCAILDALEAAAGELSYEELCEALHRRVGRWRDFRRRILKPLEDAGIVGCEGDVIRLAGEWLDKLEQERERKGEVEYAEDLAEKHRQQRNDYRDYLKAIRRGPSKAGLEAVRRSREKARAALAHHRENITGRAEEEPAKPSPLAVAVRDYLERHPHQARQPAGWIGSTLWTYDLFGGKPTPAESRAAIEELGGAAYLDKMLKRSKGAA